jgi:hypothetical protein
MKRILSRACATLACIFFSTHALATTCGPYIGVGAGKTWVKLPSGYLFIVPATGNNSAHDSGWGERAFAGFSINKYFGFEGGYARYARALYTGSRRDGAYSALTYYFHTYDIVAKAYLPIGNSGFNLYALAGAARVVQSVQYIESNFISTNGKVALPDTDGTSHGYANRPIYGLGANYNFTHHFTLNAEITQIQKMNSFGNTPYAVPFLDLATVNLAYNFG